MKLKFAFIAFTALLIVFVSCNKDKRPTIYISDELKKYYNYQPGSYWVYYDSVSGNTDSFWVYENTQGQESNQFAIYVYQSINVYHRVLDKDTFSSVVAEMKLIDDQILFGYEFLPAPNAGYSSFAFKAPYMPNVSSLNIHGKLYSDVLELKNYDSHSDGIVYLSKEIGMLKIILNSTLEKQNYNLIKWNVVR